MSTCLGDGFIKQLVVHQAKVEEIVVIEVEARS
jgi:hypothetical protein